MGCNHLSFLILFLSDTGAVLPNSEVLYVTFRSWMLTCQLIMNTSKLGPILILGFHNHFLTIKLYKLFFQKSQLLTLFVGNGYSIHKFNLNHL